MIKHCVICGKELSRDGTRRKYCSAECKRVAQNANKKSLKVQPSARTCKICGKKFFTLHSTQKCCSAECSRINKANLTILNNNRISERRRQEQTVVHFDLKTCKNCGKKFTPKFLNEKMCSDRCRLQYFGINEEPEPRCRLQYFGIKEES